MLVRLHVIRGKANKDSVAITLPAVIGRSREADLTVIHPMISRRHCELFEDGGLVKIRDLGSLNGTYVAGEQIQEAFLPPGAVFSLGPLTFRVDYDTSPKAVSHEPSVITGEGVSQSPSDIVVTDEPATGKKSLPEAGSGQPSSPEPATEPEPFLGAASTSGEFNDRGSTPPAIAPSDGVLPDFSAWQPGGESPPAPPAEKGPVENRDPSDLAKKPCPPEAAADDAWSDQPPPFTTVMSRSDTEPVAPIVLNGSDEDLSGKAGVNGRASSPSAKEIAEPARAPKTAKSRTGWWPFRR
ncbi:FHA domain-containing protein [Thermogutta sp.]|jgi:predicted component of type VI protein secretion system|uniref:FHA domain-containing protein n=1 Tax=Thermogutta sp. TaxID=1962930 RepID=UPI00321FE430